MGCASTTRRVVRSRASDIHAHWKDSAEDLRELRFAPEDFETSMTTYIYDETVTIISSRRENFAMTIESAEFAALQRQLFEALWSASTPSKGGPSRKPRTTRFSKVD